MFKIKVTDQFKTQDNDGNDIIRVRASILNGHAEVQSLAFDYPTGKTPDDIVEDLKKTLENYVLEESTRKEQEQVETTLAAINDLEVTTDIVSGDTEETK